jgi:hypothetical protein
MYMNNNDCDFDFSLCHGFYDDNVTFGDKQQLILQQCLYS